MEMNTFTDIQVNEVNCSARGARIDPFFIICKRILGHKALGPGQTALDPRQRGPCF